MLVDRDIIATNQRVVAREAGNNECWLLYDERCFSRNSILFYSVLLPRRLKKVCNRKQRIFKEVNGVLDNRLVNISSFWTDTFLIVIFFSKIMLQISFS